MFRLHFFKLSTTVILLILLTASAPLLIPAYAADKPKRSSFTYKKYKEHEEYRKALHWRMNSVYKTILDYMDDDWTLPIPGLVRTYSSASGKGRLSKQFIPQGICRAERYWLVTGYDGDKKCMTVIYVVDPERKKLITTIALPNKYHAGGIAFDGENIWITGDTSDKYKDDPFLQYIRYEDFVSMLDKPLHIMSDDDISEPVYIKNKPSFLEYDDGTLWVGTYIGKKNTSEAYMYGYKVIRADEGVRLNTIFLTVISGLDSSAQGADIEGNNLYVSSSYNGGNMVVKSSFITRYNIKPIKDGQQNLSVTSREVKRVEVPKMNEEILVEDGKIHINFESASETWKTSVIMTDRILSLDQDLWN